MKEEKCRAKEEVGRKEEEEERSKRVMKNRNKKWKRRK